MLSCYDYLIKRNVEKSRALELSFVLCFGGNVSPTEKLLLDSYNGYVRRFKKGVFNE